MTNHKLPTFVEAEDKTFHMEIFRTLDYISFFSLFFQQPVVNNISNVLTDEESKQAEAILDALIRGNITTDGVQDDSNTLHQETNDSGIIEDISTVPQEQTVTATSQPTFNGISNISEIITEDGQKIVIVIANDMPAETPAVVAPKIEVTQQQTPTVVTYVPSDQDVPVAYVSAEELDSSDSEWVPSPAPAKAQGKKKTPEASTIAKVAPIARGRVQKRGPYKRSTHSNIKDKKERKKLQNVEAARRYR